MENFKNLIEEYWNCIILNVKFTKYETFFNQFIKLLEKKLALHGQLSFEQYVSYVSEYYDLSQLKKFTYKGKHSNIVVTINDIYHAVFESRYNEFKKKYSNEMYSKLKNLYSDLSTRTHTPKDNLLLMERCIGAEHNSGNIIGLDIQTLRNEFENLIMDKSFGILNRNSLERKIALLGKSFNVGFIDFCDIHNLNKEKGYEGVNTIFKKLFTGFKFRKEDIVGRWFSGDEIVIISKNHMDNQLMRLEEYAKSLELTFKSHIFNGVSSLDELSHLINEIR